MRFAPGPTSAASRKTQMPHVLLFAAMYSSAISRQCRLAVLSCKQSLLFVSNQPVTPLSWHCERRDLLALHAFCAAQALY